MVSKKRYDNYKPSGVEWLGEIPTHWKVKQLKYAVTLINNKIDAAESSLPYMGLEHIESWTGRKLDNQEASSESTVTIYQANDILFGKLRPYLAKVYLADDNKGLCSTEALVLRHGKDSIPTFLKYYFLTKDFINTVDGSTYGSKMPRASWDFIGSLSQLLPPLPEQQAIVSFLDERTGKIDALIAHKHQLLNLLAEKRSALITQAVTKGLDPSVPLKPSGVEWLGDIPAHWEVKRLKHLALKIGSGVTPTGGANVYGSQGVAFLRSQNIHFNGLKLDDVVFIDDQIDQDMKETRVHYGDILLNITGASLGRATCFDIKNYPANVNQHVCIIRLDHNYFNFRFYTYYVSSRALQDQIFGNQQGVSREALNFEQLGNLLFVFPLDTEQQAIVAYLDERLQKLDAVKAALLTAIDRLKEYRSALITSAVTGKIDVRHLQPKETLSV
jgi:type I restriction enzyme S subunit